MPEGIRRTITLNKAGVTAPLLSAMATTAEMLKIASDGLANARLDGPIQAPGISMGWVFDMGRSPEERASSIQEILFTRAILELARGARRSLKEALLHNEIALRLPPRMREAELLARIDAIKHDAEEKHYLPLLDKVSEDLTAPLAFRDELISLNRLRNCIEHRSGIVGARDGRDGGPLVFQIPMIRLFTMIDGAEVDIRPGMHFEQDQEILVQTSRRAWAFEQGTRVRFDLSEMIEISASLNFFANDLFERLPVALPAEARPGWIAD